MDPAAVVSALALKFGINSRSLNFFENDTFQHIVRLLEGDMVIVEDYRTLGFDADLDADMDDDMEWGDDEEAPQDVEMSSQGSSSGCTSSQSSGSLSSYAPSPQKPAPRTELTHEYKMKAYLFWTCGDDGIRYAEKNRDNKKMSTVLQHFKLIKSKKILHDFANQLEKPSRRKINEAVLQRFREAVELSAIIHDRTLRLWGRQVRLLIEPEKTLKFDASDSWIYRFKKRNCIVNRAITHRVSKDWRAKETNKQAEAQIFTTKIRRIMFEHELLPQYVFNTDQSRFEKELRSYRTLRVTGTDKIRAAVGSISATTHSYMIMPVVSMSGEILRPMYVLISEANGKFPVSKRPDPANIRSFAGKTANMNKEDLRRFYTEALWPSMPRNPTKVLLLLDSWAANKDNALSDACKPNGVQLMKELIPGGCTGLIQPLDVFFFRQYKSFVRFITDTIIDETNFNVWHRDKILALQSFVLFQFSASRFKNMIRYAFYKAGFTDVEPEPWVSPHDFCFDQIVEDTCSKCNEMAFIKCAHCERSICLAHAFCSDLHIDCL